MNKAALRASGGALVMAAVASYSGAATADPVPPYFAVCSGCHTTSPGGASSQGPNLRGVVGRKAGSQPKYNYSAALKAASFNWTEKNLDQWLAKPGKMVPGTRMMTSVASAEDRKKIIEYLVTLK